MFLPSDTNRHKVRITPGMMGYIAFASLLLLFCCFRALLLFKLPKMEGCGQSGVQVLKLFLRSGHW